MVVVCAGINGSTKQTGSFRAEKPSRLTPPLIKCEEQEGKPRFQEQRDHADMVIVCRTHQSSWQEFVGVLFMVAKMYTVFVVYK